MKVVPVIRNRLRSIKMKKSNSITPEIEAWIEDSFIFIGSDPTGLSSDDNFDLNWIIQRATEAVMRYGVRILLIDPWNEIEHARQNGEPMVDYIGRSIRALKRFARERNVIVIVVAHPTKMRKKDSGALDTPTLYDIADAAHWYNKADHGIIVYRNDDVTDIGIVKSRFSEAGEPGTVRMRFDRNTHRFEPLLPA